MMIGIGNDLIDIRRIEKTLDRFGDKFIKRCFTDIEIAKAERRRGAGLYINTIAKRFAAKEAFSKALGTGVSKGINFKEIIVLNEKNGKPYIKLIDETKKAVDKKLKIKNYKISLSLSDEDKYAVAFVAILI